MGKQNKKKDFGVPEAGMAAARLVRVIDLGLQEQYAFEGKPKPPAFTMRLTFELPNDRIDIDSESRPRWIDVELPISQSELSRCFQWYNVLDPTNKYKGDWSKLVGSSCQILITHSVKPQRTYANVKSVVPLMKGLTVGELENPTTVFDLGSPDIEIFKGLPEWLQEKIRGNLEYENSKLDRLLNSLPTPASAGTGDILDEEGEADTSSRKSPVTEIPADTLDFDDSVPF